MQIEGQVFPFRGYCKGTNSRDLALFKEVVMHRSLPFRGPGPLQVGDEQKAALVEENQVGTKSLGFFLSMATDTASSSRWPPHPSSHLDAVASDNSSPSCSAASTHGRDGRAQQNGLRLLWPPALRSTDRSGSRPPGGLSAASAPTCFSGQGITGKAALEWVWLAALLAPFCGSPATTGRLNSQKRSLPALWPTSSYQIAVTEGQVGVASPVAVWFPGVSYPTG